MKLAFYPRLAWEAIRKNKRLYIPYIITCIGIITMLYIIQFLAEMPELHNMPGGNTTVEMLKLGFWIIGLFATIFLFYTNSFLMRRRKKEFGLYNILGMGKRNISVLLLWETILLYGMTLIGGIVGGILLAKLAELSLTMVIGGEANFNLRISIPSLAMTVLIFSVIFLFVFLKSILQLRKLNAIALLKSETVGEKPPKANYLLGIAGFIILAVAYYIAVTIDNPVSAIGWFFIAVGLVIVATYLIFIAGSVVFCKILQKNKSYYYQKNHFVSVSSMAYRMKRNGAGLASISILSTMVLVMMMGSGSLYFGKEDSINTLYPHDITAASTFLSRGEEARYNQETVALINEEVDTILDDFGVNPLDVEQIVNASVTGMLEYGKLRVDREMINKVDAEKVDKVIEVFIATPPTTIDPLEENEVLIYTKGMNYEEPTITLHDGTVWNVKENLSENLIRLGARNSVLPTLYIFTSNLEEAIDRFNSELEEGIDIEQEEDYFIHLDALYSFDTELPREEQIQLGNAIRERLRELNIEREIDFYSYGVSIKEEERAEFYGLFGGLFFLGIFLSILFMAATVLIIYYKQITEGYEDEGRFEIMRKVGMTTEDIKQTINSQILTVFFLPLIASILHVVFAFPMVQKLLSIFSLTNTLLSITVTAIATVIFTIFYAVIYRVTSNAYYNIVSNRKE